MFIFYYFSMKKIENISIENSDKLSVLLLSLKNFNIIQFIMIPRFSIYSILITKYDIYVYIYIYICTAAEFIDREWIKFYMYNILINEKKMIGYV